MSNMENEKKTFNKVMKDTRNGFSINKNLQGKTLLVLTGCNGANDIIEYAKANGVYTIATDYNEISPIKDLADCRYNVSTTDIDAVYDIAKKHKVDGITTGTSEASMYTILHLSKRLDIPFYTTNKQLEVINNKRKFKELLASFNIPCTKTFNDVSEVEYPVIVKPVDSSGSKGISICRKDSELNDAIKLALDYSRSKQVIMEKCIENCPEVFFNYTVVDGHFSLSCGFDNYKNRDKYGFAGDAVINMYPSKNLDKYLMNLHKNVVSALSSIGLKNGVISIQTFFDGDTFFVYEAGYRLGGTQSYIFCNEINGINYMEMMVNYALTGRMSDDKNQTSKDNPFFNRPCCQRNISIKDGTIASIEGINEIQKLKGVLNVTQVKNVGDIIHTEGARTQLCLRIHIIGDTINEISDINDRINSLVEIKDANGDDMVIDRYKIHT